jgi:hypothetical protein
MTRYTLNDFSNISSDGFDFTIPPATLKIINELATQVGSPTYIKTPNFNKDVKNNGLGNGSNGSGGSGSGGSSGLGGGGSIRRKRGGAVEVVNDEDWETIRTYQPTKIEQKEETVDKIRLLLNKMTDKNYQEQFGKILEILDTLTDANEIMKVSTSIFDIASNNRFYSKLYADLYTELIHKYEIMNTIFEENLNKFLELFQHIEYIDSSKDYDKFCKINKDNEKRKALSAFIVNLTHNNIISSEKLFELTFDLLGQILVLIDTPDKKNEVDEIVENIAILYSPSLFRTCTLQIDGKNILTIINTLSESKIKSHLSLTNKTIFKFMDLKDAK